jgi:putative tryptophan/tyrosine transport system substrate-binding protein
MKRRDFITLLGGAATASSFWAPAAGAQQQAKIPEIGFLDTSPGTPSTLAGFRAGLMEAGYVEGRNVKFRFGSPNQTTERVARELVSLQVAVIVAFGGLRSLLAAKAATSTIPIVYEGGADPVELGVAASLNRPGGNVTGISVIFNALGGKRLDLLLKLVPDVTTVGYLIGGARETAETDEVLASARALGCEVIVLECHSPEDLDSAFRSMKERGVGAVMVSAFPVAFNHRKQVVALAAEHRLPAIYAQASYVYEGGLMSYMPVVSDRDLAIQYVAKILNGVKPADLPIQQPSKFELAINRTTAKALGLTIPATIELLIDRTVD